MPALDGKDRPRLMVFSHPNHELAVFGCLQRLRPHLLFLSDGGSAARVEESRRALDSIALLDRARFLDQPEAAFYAALLQHDVGFCEGIAAAIRNEIDAIQPEYVLCDAVEFYNPVHDLSLPLVLRAAPTASVFEVPLVYQQPGAAESYAVQQLPPSQRHDQEVLHLTDDEVDAKIGARDTIYHQLRQQLGGVLNVPRAHAMQEVVRPFRGRWSEPDADRVMRYDWRARLLQGRGTVQEVITYADHYRPLVQALGAPL